MDENPYWPILQARKEHIHNVLRDDFAATYILLAITIMWLVAMGGPIFALIIDSWIANAVNIPLTIFASLSLVFGSVLSCVLRKIGKFHGTWKRPTFYSDDGTRFRSSGLWFYPPSACRIPLPAVFNSSADLRRTCSARD